MNVFVDVVRDLDGVIVAGAKVYIYGQDGKLADLLAVDEVTPLENPLTSDDKGQVKAWIADDGYYTAEYFWGGRKRFVRANVLLGAAPIEQTQENAAQSALILDILYNLALGIGFTSVEAGIAGTTNNEWFGVIAGGRAYVYLNDDDAAVPLYEIATVAAMNAIFDETLALLRPNDSIRYYGYVADGTLHPLSGVTLFKGVDVTGWTLGQWQTAVPQVTSLTNSIDAIAVQAWFNDRDDGGALTLPAGEAVWNIGVVTGEDQNVSIAGVSRDVTRIRFTGTGTFWKHGYTGSVAATGTFTAENFTVIPAAGAASACCFNVRFSGDQRPWCHNVRDVLIYPEDGDSYFTNPTITRNIKRGLDWDRFIVYGRHFYTQSTPAHIFPPNVASDPDCPPGQAQTVAGNSYSIEDCMCIGYFDGWEWDFTGFTSAVAHCHEQVRMLGCEAYSGVGFVSIVDTNTNYAPADNFLFEHCGWQGTGRAFDLEYCEFVVCTGMLFVNNTTTENDHVWGANIINCRDVFFAHNEFFLVDDGSSDLTVFYVDGADTAGVEIKDNATVSYTTIDQWLYIGASCPEGTVEERGNRFRGTGTYSAGKVVDASGVNISETRVNDIMAAFGSASASWNVRPNGDIVFSDVQVRTTVGTTWTGTLPTGLFRSIKSGLATSNTFTMPVGHVDTITLTAVPISIPAATNSSVSVTMEIVGR